MNAPATLIHSQFVTIVFDKISPVTINNNDARFISALDAIKKKDWAALSEVLTLPKAIAKFTAGKVKVFENAVTYKDKQIHGTVVTRLLEFLREGYPLEPITNFIDKLMENPSERSKEQLYNYLELYKLPICDDGDFIAQKKVNKEFKDFHTRTIDNSVGKIVEMDRKLVNDDPNQGCHQGLHIGSEDFVQTFGGEGVVILVKINPKDVVSVPFDASYAKMRVCRYEVIKALGNDSSKFNSDYAPATSQAEDIVELDSGDYISERENNFGTESNLNEVILSNQAAYEAHKAGTVLTNGVAVIQPSERKARWFFRANKGTGWKKYTAVTKAENGEKISKNKAYELYKAGKKVYSPTYGYTSSPTISRKTFRKYNDWQLIK
jgi:hypothetical protein